MTGRLKHLRDTFKKGGLSKTSYIRKMHDTHKLLWEYRDFIADKNISAIKISPEEVSLTTQDGITMICDPLDHRSIPLEIMNFNDYELSELRMIQALLNPKSVVIDIGANTGWYSLSLSKHIPKGRIVAFEPLPEIYSLLKRNIELNHCKNIRALNIGLAEKKGACEFYYNPKVTGATSLRDLNPEAKAKKVTCKVETLDSMMRRLPSHIDLIKIDVEGAELLVIKGALALLRATTPVLFLEMLRKWSAKFSYHPNDIIALLGSIGYRCYCVKHGRLAKVSAVTDNTQETNFFFLNTKKHAHLIKKLTRAKTHTQVKERHQ